METCVGYYSRNKRVLLKPDKCWYMHLKRSFNNILKLCHKSMKTCELEIRVVIEISGMS